MKMKLKPNQIVIYDMRGFMKYEIYELIDTGGDINEDE